MLAVQNKISPRYIINKVVVVVVVVVVVYKQASRQDKGKKSIKNVTVFPTDKFSDLTYQQLRNCQ